MVTIIQGVLHLTFLDRGTNARRQRHTWCFQPVGCRTPSTVPILVAAILLADVIKTMYAVPHHLWWYKMFQKLFESQ
jgi:hypothetical protein